MKNEQKKLLAVVARRRLVEFWRRRKVKDVRLTIFQYRRAIAALKNREGALEGNGLPTQAPGRSCGSPLFLW